MFEITCRIRYSEIDRGGHLSMKGLLRLFQDCGYSHAKARGQGHFFTKNPLFTWYLISWHIHQVRMPVLDEEVTISTWFHEIQESRARKSVMMKDKYGNILAVAETVWVYMDVQNQTSTLPPQDQWPKEDFGEKAPMPAASRRIELPEGLAALPSVSLKPALLDLNDHANNVFLTEFAMDLCGADNGCSDLRAEFKRQVKAGCSFCPHIGKKDETVFVALKNEEGQYLAVFSFLPSNP